MIAVSSFRQRTKCADEIWRNQIAAKKSWEQVFSGIIYFGWPPDPELVSEKTAFVEWEDFPTIKAMCECCAVQTQMSAIVNADIILSQEFKRVEMELLKIRAQSAVSKRYQFDPNDRKKGASVTDEGLDIFVATPSVWKNASNEVPEQFRLGHILWDTWMLSFLYHTANCWDFTRMKAVFHPIHENRMRPFTLDCKMPNDRYLHRVRYPRNILK